MEVELQQLYQDYLVRFRCLAYLEQQQDESEQAEQERMEARKVTSLWSGVGLCSLLFFSFFANISNMGAINITYKMCLSNITYHMVHIM